MANLLPQPKGLAGWKAYANSEDVTSIPLREAHDANKTLNIATFRGVHLDASKTLQSSLRRLHIYSDVLAFTEREIAVSPCKNGTIEIMARVLTADAPVNIVFPSSASGAISIYAAVLDQPVTVSTADQSVTIDLGPESANAGVALSFSKGKLECEYWKKGRVIKSSSLKSSLETQLRIALVQFWINSSIAISLCSWIAKMTANEEFYGLLNTQAVALGQQLAGQAISGPNMSYAPVLVHGRYKESMQQALAAATAFEHQFERFQDKKESLEKQIQAWDNMISQIKNVKSLRANLKKMASDKYDSASETVKACEKEFEADNAELKSLQKQFDDGIKKWKHKQEEEAAFEILGIIAGFAIGIGELCIGDPAGVVGATSAVNSAVKSASAIEKLVGKVGKFLSSETFRKIAECTKGISEMYPKLQKIIEILRKFQSGVNVKIPTRDQISGTSTGDANSAAIVAVSAWEKWVLESDDQMEFAVTQGIDSASDYRLALRKHAINGKQLALAQAESLNVGNEYIQAQMEEQLADEQIKTLQKLKEDFEGQEAVYAQAEAMFYDRAMALRTSVVISLRNLAWAYRYWALAESSVVLNARKSLAEYEQDLSTIVFEFENADSRYPSDFQPFEYDIKSKNLPAGFGPPMIEDIKGDKRSGNFTLYPKGDLASKFNRGSHYRLSGLDPTLRGVLPNPDKLDDDGKVDVQLQITTSGIYSDINDNKIFHFQCLPQVRRCTYALDRQGVRGRTSDNPTFDTTDHAEPTPFTQWVIKVMNPDDLILDGLEGIDLKFSGHVRFDKGYIAPGPGEDDDDDGD